MESIVQALGVILLKALPTFFLVVLLHFYLKYMFFGPLEKVLHRRYEVSEGARVAAEESLQRAATKTEEYEQALRAAKTEVFQAQEAAHRELQRQHDAAIQAARADAEAAIRKAKAELRGDAEAARQSLRVDTDGLADQIADAILSRRAA
jgi:F-type H+-transporting ATPase subunit b